MIFACLPKNGLWDTVVTDEPVRRRPLYRWVCPHNTFVAFSRTNHRVAARCYTGLACGACGYIHDEWRTF